MSTLPDFSQARVLIVGDVMLDRYWQGKSSRISPEAPIPVVNVESLKECPGGAANAALNARDLGADVSLIGFVGNDTEASTLESQLNAKGVKTHLIRCDDKPTITKLRVLSHNQQMLRLDFEKHFHDVDKTSLHHIFQSLLSETNIVLLSDYGKGTLQDAVTLINKARDSGLPVVVDPKSRDFDHYRGASLLTPNLKEFIEAKGTFENETGLEKKALETINKHHLDALLVTRSEAGVSLFQPGKPVYTSPAQSKEVFDVSGAGDTVIATLACTLAAGETLETATHIANIAAGITITKLGASTVTPIELERALIELDPTRNEKIVSLEQLLSLRNDAKRRGKKVVMTNGCFDILHAGHIAYLREAKAQGDYLILAVNTDASVERLKGPTRPLNTVHDRMEVLSALSSIDWVIPFDTDTPQALIAKVLPDVLVKGGDYQVHEVAGHREVLDSGGEVKMLVFKDGYSTTQLVHKIKETEL